MDSFVIAPFAFIKEGKTMKRSKYTYILIILFLAGLVFYLPGNQAADINLSAKENVPKGSIDALQVRMEALVLRVDVLEAENAAQKTGILALRTENASQAVLINALEARDAALMSEDAWQTGFISTLKTNVSTLKTDMANLQAADPVSLAGIFVGVSRIGDDIFFDHVNVHIRNGLGETDGVPDGIPTVPGITNGLGNLIIGYDEKRTFKGAINDKTGSHNLVVGPEHNYSNTGGLVAGFFNTISGRGASVSGGYGNKANSLYSSVSGGQANIASGFRSSVSGGIGNTASGTNSSVSGGRLNEASGFRSSVSGGIGNTASGTETSVSGGKNHEAGGPESSIRDGISRSAPDTFDRAAGSLF